MKKNDLKQLVALTVDELLKKEKDLQKEIADAFFDKNMKKLKDTKLISKRRKDLAQVLTVKRQKELLEQLESKTKKSEKEEKIEVKEDKKAKKGAK